MKDVKLQKSSGGEKTAGEVRARPTRRTFTAGYKRKMLAQVDGCERGELGQLLRREGLYSSHIETWRRQIEQGLTPKKRGPKVVGASPLRAEVEELRREVARLRARLHKAETVIDVQKKVSALLGLPASEEQS